MPKSVSINTERIQTCIALVIRWVDRVIGDIDFLSGPSGVKSMSEHALMGKHAGVLVKYILHGWLVSIILISKSNLFLLRPMLSEVKISGLVESFLGLLAGVSSWLASLLELWLWWQKSFFVISDGELDGVWKMTDVKRERNKEQRRINQAHISSDISQWNQKLG